MPRRKKVERERMPPVLASEAGLCCRLYRQGTKVTCGKPATCFRPGVGDMCDEHPQAKGAIRYAVRRATELAAEVPSGHSRRLCALGLQAHRSRSTH